MNGPELESWGPTPMWLNILCYTLLLRHVNVYNCLVV